MKLTTQIDWKTPFWSTLNFAQVTHAYAWNCNPTSSGGVDASMVNGSQIALVHAGGAKALAIMFCGDDTLGTICANSTLRTQFVANVKTVMQTNYNGQYLDGVCIDWEDENQPPNTTTAGFNSLITDLYNAFQPIGKIVHVYLGAYLRGDPSQIPTPSVANAYVDALCIGTYWQWSASDAEAEMTAWAAIGYSKNILCMGWQTELDYDDKENPFHSYGALVDEYNPPTNTGTSTTIESFTDPAFGTVYTGNTLYWQSLTELENKANWIITQGYGGAFCYTFSEDKLNDSRSLVQTAYNILFPSGFTHGTTHTASLSITDSLAGKPCQVQLQIGTSLSNKVSFTSGSNVPVSIPITMPAAGTYPVYIDVYMEGVLIQTGTDPNQVTVV
jgi:hypothetical protein